MAHIICRLLGHRWASMVTVPGDLCLRCSAVMRRSLRSTATRAELEDALKSAREFRRELERQRADRPRGQQA